MAEEQNTTAEEYENQEQTASGEGDENLRKLFLGGLKRSITKEDLEEHFRAQGDVVNISLATDNQNVSKGFGFVTMRTVEDTDKILRAHEDKTTELQGRKIEVRRAIPRNSNVPSDVVKKVFVAGLNRGTITEDDLRDYFNTIAEVKSVSIVMDKNTNQSKGFAFVEMEYFYMVDKAALMTNHFVNGTKIDVNKAHADKGGRGGGRGGFGGGRGGRGGGGFGRGGGSGYGSYYSGRDWGNGYSDYDSYGGGGYDDYYGGGMSGYGPQRSYGSRGRGRGGRGGGYRPY